MKLPVFRYRITTLLGFMLLIATAAAVYGNHLRALERQQRAFEAIAAKGGWVLWHGEGVTVGFGMPPWKAPGSFLCGTGLHGAFGPTIDTIAFGDLDLMLLDDVLNLRSVEFRGSLVSPSGQRNFAKSHAGCQLTP